VEVVPSDFGESLQKSSFDCPAEYVKETALQKALCVAQRLKNETVSTVSIFKLMLVILPLHTIVVTHTHTTV